MDAKALDALKRSITEKWEPIRDGRMVDLGIANCPLCYLYVEDDCCGCPISEKTGLPGCGGTPYMQWDDYFELKDISEHKVTDPESEALAQAEIDFLRSLLPEGETA